MSAFDRVRRIGLTLPDVEAGIRYDGSPRLTLRGCFVAGLATDATAEPDTLVVRADPDDRLLLVEEAPETYYLTDSYRRHPVVLARLSTLPDDALRDLLATSRRLTLPKIRSRSKRPLAQRRQ